ncbi:MAG: 50S ribosomal protein L22 [Gracilibacteraceae bacterium]|jgi:large subunit ribosomal protein L22|nr:50S ribosomal protein L22 [Gracilibacteraceae bacterium]
MEAKAVARNIRVSPRKARLVVDLIRGKKVDEAEAILRFVPGTAKEPVRKALKSAVANAEHNLDLEPGSLYVTRIFVDQGPTMKRIQPRARGRADRIRKRMSHITVIVGDRKGEV